MVVDNTYEVDHVVRMFLLGEKGSGGISSILVKKKNVSYMLKQTQERHGKQEIVLSRSVRGATSRQTSWVSLHSHLLYH